MSAEHAAPDAIRLTLDRGLARGFAIAMIAGTALALGGVFGTDEAPLGARLAYWLPLMLAGSVWGHLCSRYVERFVALDERPWLMAALLAGIIWAPLSLLVWLVTGPAFAGGMLSLSALPGVAFYVLVVTVPISVLSVFLQKGRPVQTRGPDASRPSQAVRFLDRMPPRLRGARLLAVQAEDHYLRLHTDRGSDLVLMRLSDAVAELEGLEGAQVHRSWWVARAAVSGVARGDGRATLTLDGEIQAPVSRRYARALRAAGWY